MAQRQQRTDPPYTIEFYEDERGREPVAEWIRKKLTPTQRRALVMAMNEVLAYEGLGVIESEFGKPTSKTNVKEFRLRQDPDELLSRIKRAPRGARRAPAALDAAGNGP